MAANATMVPLELFEVAEFIMNVDMFPVFFTAHFVVACLIVREDSKDLGQKFLQNHPFASWICTVIAGLSGVFVANFLFGDPLIDVMKENVLILYLTGVWYFMNYCPFDIVYKVVTLPPVILSASVLQECLRVRFIYLGLQQAAKTYPGAYIIIILGGVIKGNGYGFIKIVERLIRGKWTPSNNEILEVTYFAKSGLYSSVAFLLHHIKIVTVPIEILYLGVIIIFVLLRMTIMIGKVQDPLLPFETPVCRLLFGKGGKEDSKENTGKQKDEKEKTEKEKREKKTK